MNAQLEAPVVLRIISERQGTSISSVAIAEINAAQAAACCGVVAVFKRK